MANISGINPCLLLARIWGTPLLALLRTVVVLVSLSAGVANADLMFEERELQALRHEFENTQCLVGCETANWTIRAVQFPANTQDLIDPSDVLFVVISKSEYCGSRGCVVAYVLRDNTQLVALASGYNLDGITAVDIPPSGTRKELPHFARAIPVSSNLPVASSGVEDQEVAKVVAERICDTIGGSCREKIADVAFSWLAKLGAVVVSDEKDSSYRFALLFSNPGAIAEDTVRLRLFEEALSNEDFVRDLKEIVLEKRIDTVIDGAARTLAGGIIMSIMTGLVTEQLARHQERQGRLEAANITRTWFKPLAKSSLIVVNASTVTSGIASAGIIWARNIVSFALLGARLNADEIAGRDFNNQLRDLAARNASITETLIRGQLWGVMFDETDWGTPITPRHAEVLQSILTENYKLQNELLSSNSAVTMRMFGFVNDAAQKFADLVLGTTGGRPPIASGLEHANSTPALPGNVAPLTIPQGKFSASVSPNVLFSPEPNFVVKKGQTIHELTMKSFGEAFFSGQPIFPRGPYDFHEDERYLTVYLSQNSSRALVQLWDADKGGLRMALVDRVGSKVLNNQIIPDGNVLGLVKADQVRWVNNGVAWSPDGRFAAVPYLFAEAEADLAVIDIVSGEFVIYPVRTSKPASFAFPDVKTIQWHADDTLTVPVGTFRCVDSNCEDFTSDPDRQMLSLSLSGLINKARGNAEAASFNQCSGVIFTVRKLVKFCDFFLDEKGVVHYRNQKVSEPIIVTYSSDGSQYLADSLTIYPSSPSGRYYYIKACEEGTTPLCWSQWLFDSSLNKFKSISIGKYGAHPEIYWNSNDRFAALFYSDEGDDQIHILDAETGKTWEFPDWGSNHDSNVLDIDKKSFTWIDSSSFHIDATYCIGRAPNSYCDEKISESIKQKTVFKFEGNRLYPITN